MNRVLTSLAFCLIVATAGRAADSAVRPNVLLILSDDQGWSDYGFMGHASIKTPHLDRLAERSLTFLRGYSPVPLCRPALASIATGLYPSQHGVTGNDPALPAGAGRAMAGRANPQLAPIYQKVIGHFAEHPNFIRDLTKRGYLTMQSGKWWEGDPVANGGFTAAMTKGTGPGARHGDVGLEIGRKGLEPVLRFIDQAGDKPWFLWYAPMMPHAPHDAPRELVDKYLKLAPTRAVARYWASVEWFDRTCGELLDHLEKKGLRDNTIVIYTTDNGYIQDPDRPDNFAPRSKRTPYEGGVRTPLLISWPTKIRPQVDRDHLACNLDIWPTVAALLGYPAPDGLPGINLTDDKAVAARQRILGEQYAHDIADVDKPTRSIEARWQIDGWWKLIVPAGNKANAAKPELYDLRDDPWEKKNLADTEAERLAAMLRAMPED